jgi:hypothetical protein
MLVQRWPRDSQLGERLILSMTTFCRVVISFKLFCAQEVILSRPVGT